MTKEKSKSLIPSERIEQAIYVIREHNVMLDEDLASLYGAETKVLNQAVRRNLDRFPSDFAFKLTQNEWNILRSQIVTSKSTRGGRRYTPFVFTEYGVVMVANLLKSKQAILISIEIVRTFIHLRQIFSSHKEIKKELSELKSFILKHSQNNDREFKKVWQAIEKLTNPPIDETPRKIGFDLS